jgi:hypothetical protein
LFVVLPFFASWRAAGGAGGRRGEGWRTAATPPPPAEKRRPESLKCRGKRSTALASASARSLRCVRATMTTVHLVTIDAVSWRARERIYSSLPVRFGRGPENECTLEDVSVSHFHAELAIDGEELILRDLGSETGTLCVEGSRIRRLRRETARVGLPRIDFVIGQFLVSARLESGPGGAQRTCNNSPSNR